jgi:serine/threonine protein kinase
VRAAPGPGQTSAPGPEQSALAPGYLVGGRYRAESLLARGAMGEVWRGRDEHLHDRACAIKTVHFGGATPEERAERRAWFAREAEVLARLRHPAICDLRDSVVAGDTQYLILELIEGRTLEAELAARGAPGLPQHEVLAWAAALCDALGYLHGQSPPLIFRDLKPQNIMRRTDGRVVLIDFGLARAVVQRGGTAIGTAGYAPPEQYQGLADARSDVYALAATLHHLLTGRDPTGETPFTFPPARSLVPGLSAVVEAALARALRMAPADRFPTIAEFGAALSQPPPSPAGPSSGARLVPPQRSARDARRPLPRHDQQDQEALYRAIPEHDLREHVRRTGEDILAVQTVGLTVSVMTARAVYLMSSSGQLVTVDRAAARSVAVQPSGRWPMQHWEVVVTAPERLVLARFAARGDAEALARTIETWRQGDRPGVPD